LALFYACVVPADHLYTFTSHRSHYFLTYHDTAIPIAMDANGGGC